jgi:hypothetical protein
MNNSLLSADVHRRLSRGCLGALVSAMIIWQPNGASAGGLFDQLFGGFLRAPASQPSPQPLAYANPVYLVTKTPAQQSVGSSVAYCVRLCDGRFFPVPHLNAATPVQQCNALCPASPTKIYSGGNIGGAVAADGSRYAALKNAFVYRKRLVPSCTCNGKDQIGLARVGIDTDVTLQTGDIVATDNDRVALVTSRSKHGEIRTATSRFDR